MKGLTKRLIRLRHAAGDNQNITLSRFIYHKICLLFFKIFKYFGRAEKIIKLAFDLSFLKI